VSTAINHDRAVFPASERQSFDCVLANAVRILRRDCPDLTPRESQLLTDVARGRSRAFRLVAEVADIARHRCFDPASAAAIAEGIRGYILADHPRLVLPWIDTLRYEGATNAIADEALVEHLLTPSKATKERMVEAHVAQSIASRAVADLMYRERR
jgi:hypothetical protein